MSLSVQNKFETLDLELFTVDIVPGKKLIWLLAILPQGTVLEQNHHKKMFQRK